MVKSTSPIQMQKLQVEYNIPGITTSFLTLWLAFRWYSVPKNSPAGGIFGRIVGFGPMWFGAPRTIFILR